MTTPFAQFNSYGGYIGRLGWWNTMDTQAVNPRCPVDVRLWGKGPFLLQGWGSGVPSRAKERIPHPFLLKDSRGDAK